MKSNQSRNPVKSADPVLANVLVAAVNRVDQWRELHALSRAWATATPGDTQADNLHAEAVRLLASISRLEHCWAYPGHSLLAALGESLAQRDAATFARLVQKVSGALLSGDYRRSDFAWIRQRKATRVPGSGPAPGSGQR